MTHQEHAKAVFLEAVEQHGREAWPAFLDEACAGDVALRQQVEQLLRAHIEMGTYQDGPVSQERKQLDATSDFAPDSLSPGATVGAYKLLQQIGEGGFGVVFMAEQLEPVRRQVALKIIKPGMDTKEVIARFEAERQALALMDHPNIAQVLDAGATPDKRPYFVMELVKGVPVTEFCDKHNLSTRQRLDLFSAICNAVQHAHQKGVIHRDIKPSNVMVTLHDGKPVVKVIDFGISKAISQRLTEKTLFTQYGQMVGTPQYMSPEQAEMSGLDIDTRSDIYSLGVLLYELLIGTTPLEANRLRSAGYAEMLRLIQEEEPPKPSTRLSTLNERLSIVCKQRSTDGKRLRQLVRGDLDWIVMKSLEKDRSRRYETASAFAADIERHLKDEPVAAGPPSAIYRLRKFARRNKGSAIAVSAIATALVLGLTASTMGFLNASYQSKQAFIATREAESASQRAKEQEQKAQAERNEAQAQQQRAESVLALMKRMLSSAGLTAENPRDYTVRQMLDDFSETLDYQFEDSPETGTEIWAAIGEAYHSLEELERAAAARRKALVWAEKAFHDRPAELARLLFFTGWTLLDLGHPEIWAINAVEAERYLEKAVALYAKLPEHDQRSRRDFAEATIVYAWSLQVQHRFDEAMENHTKALEMQMRMDPPERFALATIGSCLQWQGKSAEVLKKTDEALPTLRKAMHYGEKGEDLRTRYVHLIWSLALRGFALWDLARFDDARKCIDEALTLAESGKEHALESYVNQACLQAWIALGQGQDAFAKNRLAELLQLSRTANKPSVEMRVLRNIAAMTICHGDLRSAEEQLINALQIGERRYAPDHVLNASCRFWLALHYEHAQDENNANQLISAMIGEVEYLVSKTNQHPEWLAKLSWVKSHFGSSNEDDLIESIRLGKMYLNSNCTYDRPLVRLAMAQAELRLGDFDAAIAILRQGQQERWATPGWIVPVYEGFTIERELIQLLMKHRSPPEVEAALRQSIDDRKKYLTSKHPATLESRVRLASWLVDQDRANEVLEMLDEFRVLADHSEASKGYRQFAIETAIKLHRALQQPDMVRQWLTKLEALEASGASSDGKTVDR